MYSFLHIETSGPEPLSDRILFIAILNHNGKNPTDSFSGYLAALHPIPSRRMLPDEIIPEQPLQFHHVARKIVELTDDKILVAHDALTAYAFLKQEFRQLGYTFQRKMLCTQRLTRKLFPDLPSHSLRRLASHFDLSPPGATETSGNAQLTMALFFKLMQLKERGEISFQLDRETTETHLSPALSGAQIQSLPEKTGVYFFYGENRELLYIGKSCNIRKRVHSHFRGMMNAPLERAWKEQVHHIEFEVTGSELIALLYESHLIKEQQPLYNRDQKTINYRFGLFPYTNNKGYLCFRVAALSNELPEPLRVFRSKSEGDSFLSRLSKELHLCQKLCHLDHSRGGCFGYHLGMCNGACCGKEDPKAYNRRAKKVFGEYRYPYPDFLVIGEGRHSDEWSVVDVCNGVYRGFGFTPRLSALPAVHELKQVVLPRPEYPDIRRIIISCLRDGKGGEVIRYRV